jgi:cysteinyl-tRNA synthetase
MSMEYLGDTLDIHTGGIDHIPVHHTNEIAQSEAATNQQFVRFWVHHNFIHIKDEKMSKSKKNYYTIDEVIAKGFDPLALRYLFLTGHYREQMNFTWESLQATQNALNNLRDQIRSWDNPSEINQEYYNKFLTALNNDLNSPQAIAVLHDLTKSDLDSSIKSATLIEMDKILGLGLVEFINQTIEIPEAVEELVQQREEARKNKDFAKSDELRDKIKEFGFEVKDTSSGPQLSKIQD